MSIEAMKQALEALKSMKETLAEHDEPTTFNEDEAIKALEETLKQEQGEPVAWMYESVCGNDFVTRNSPPDYAKNIRPLGYITPQQRKPLTVEEIAELLYKFESASELVADKRVEGMVMMTPDEFKSVWDKAQSEEREACALIGDGYHDEEANCGDLIRARGQA